MASLVQLDGLIDLLVEAVMREIREVKARMDASPERVEIEKEVGHDKDSD